MYNASYFHIVFFSDVTKDEEGFSGTCFIYLCFCRFSFSFWITQNIKIKCKEAEQNML